MRKRFIVTGKVQGVGYRYFVRQQAVELGISGRVWNSPDGTVAVEADGSADRLERLVTLLRQGPTGAAVRDVKAEPLADGEPLPAPFSIERVAGAAAGQEGTR